MIKMPKSRDGSTKFRCEEGEMSWGMEFEKALLIRMATSYRP